MPGNFTTSFILSTPDCKAKLNSSINLLGKFLLATHTAKTKGKPVSSFQAKERS